MRLAKGLRLVDLAQVVNKDQAVYARYERGDVNPPDEAKLALAAFYGVTVSYVMGWNDEANGAAA